MINYVKSISYMLFTGYACMLWWSAPVQAETWRAPQYDQRWPFGENAPQNTNSRYIHKSHGAKNHKFNYPVSRKYSKDYLKTGNHRQERENRRRRISTGNRVITKQDEEDDHEKNQKKQKPPKKQARPKRPKENHKYIKKKVPSTRQDSRPTTRRDSRPDSGRRTYKKHHPKSRIREKIIKRDKKILRHQTTERVIVRDKRRHRPRYNLYNRHKHVYYRTPWYSTRYIAPIQVHYHPIGYRTRVLPKSYVRVVVGGLPFFYYSGVYYKSYSGGYMVVAAPIGALVRELPIGFIAFSLGAVTYYYINDTYYLWEDEASAYRVVDKPDGADSAIEEATIGRLFIYPNKGQSEEQQAKDRYECHRWAVTESGVDPTLEDMNVNKTQRNNYQRAITACLEGRDYTVK